MAFRKLINCLACNSKNLKQVLNLNKQPLANSFLIKKNLKEKKYNLKVNCCLNCTHLQLSLSVDPKIIYTKYDYTVSILLSIIQFLPFRRVRMKYLLFTFSHYHSKLPSIYIFQPMGIHTIFSSLLMHRFFYYTFFCISFSAHHFFNNRFPNLVPH